MGSQEKFDIITSDPIHPWVKGSATLYSKEYFQLVKDHLNPGGVVTQWVPLYESNAETVKSEIATFFDVFPNGTVWANEIAVTFPSASSLFRPSGNAPNQRFPLRSSWTAYPPLTFIGVTAPVCRSTNFTGPSQSPTQKRPLRSSNIEVI